MAVEKLERGVCERHGCGYAQIRPLFARTRKHVNITGAYGFWEIGDRADLQEFGQSLGDAAAPD